MENKKGIISAKDWDKGIAGETSSAKATKVLKYLESLSMGAAAPMSAIKEGSGLTWPYSTVKALVKSKTVEQKKLGKALYYRIKVR